MGIFKILGYAVGGVVIGVGAVAAAPFTGGGSLLGAATLAGSLAGAGTIAAAGGAAAVAGGTGLLLANREEKENEEKDTKIAGQGLQIDKITADLNKAINQFQGDKEYFNFIIGATALGISMANADGEISFKEIDEFKEFIGGVAAINYPPHIKEQIMKIFETKPNLPTAIKYLENINPNKYELIRNMLTIVADADGKTCDKEEIFLISYDKGVKEIVYKPADNDTEDSHLKKVQCIRWTKWDSQSYVYTESG